VDPMAVEEAVSEASGRSGGGAVSDVPRMDPTAMEEWKRSRSGRAGGGEMIQSVMFKGQSCI
jgi:hypothetical protein